MTTGSPQYQKNGSRPGILRGLCRSRRFIDCLQPEREMEEQCKKEGLHLLAAVAEDLKKLGDRFGVSFS